MTKKQPNSDKKMRLKFFTNRNFVIICWISLLGLTMEGKMVAADILKPFTLSSSAFIHETDIQSQYTCEGKDVSPSLKWENPPAGTKSYVLIMDDPDAPGKTWVHWILFNIPASILALEENIKNLPSGTKEGQNSWEKTGYGGPCPPSGKHRYYFKLYALDTVLALDAGVSKAEIGSAMDGHILAKAELMGYYQKKKI